MTVALAHPESLTVNENTSFAARAVGLCKTIDTRAVLRDVSFAIHRNEFVALMGANGAGKSTLLKILATLTQPTAGELHLLEFSLGSRAAGSAARQTEVRKRIGLIGHGSMLYRDLSAKENLVFFGKLYGVINPSQRADELLDWIGLSHRSGDAVKTFSRGMTQRVAIARALMHKPEVLLADEPFAGLDAPSANMLEHMLQQLHREGQTIILASHDLHQSLELAQRVLVLRQGELVLDQTAARLTSSQLMREVSGS